MSDSGTGEMSTAPDDQDYSPDEKSDGIDPEDVDDDSTTESGPNADEVTAGPAEEADPGNDNPATTAAVE